MPVSQCESAAERLWRKLSLCFPEGNKDLLYNLHSFEISGSFIYMECVSAYTVSRLFRVNLKLVTRTFDLLMKRKYIGKYFDTIDS